MKKKILILTNNSGGLYDFRKELICELVKSYDVAALTPFGIKIPELRALGCRVVQTEFNRRGMNPIKDLSLFRTYETLIKAEKPDLILTYTIKPNIYGGLIGRLRHIRYAANITGLGTSFENRGVLRFFVTNMYRASLKEAKVVFFENAANRQLFLDERIIREDQSCLLNGAGVNLEKFSLQPYPHNQNFRFLFIGRVMKEKGIEELLSAMRMLREEGENCILDVVGSFEENYRELFAQAEAAGWLKYHGYQTDVRPFIKDCDCFVLPSWHEGMANTNLECAASGRPVITSNIPGCREAVADGVSGFLCEAKDAVSLYRAMKKMAEESVGARTEMGLVGRKRMEAMFDKRKVVEETLRFLER